MDDNVTDLNARRISELMVQHWSDAYSDNGAIWKRSGEALEVIRANVSEEVWEDAHRMASLRWKIQ
jgi:hypothetical protein